MPRWDGFYFLQVMVQVVMMKPGSSYQLFVLSVFLSDSRHIVLLRPSKIHIDAKKCGGAHTDAQSIRRLHTIGALSYFELEYLRGTSTLQRCGIQFRKKPTRPYALQTGLTKSNHRQP